MMKNNVEQKEPEEITLWQAVKSVLASFIGIQNKKNMERDAQSDKNIPIFLAVGFILAILLHVIIYIAVKIILWQSGIS